MTLISALQLKNKPLPSEHVGPLDRDVIVLRKIDMRKLPDGIYEMVSKQHITPGVPEHRMPWFVDGYVANDLPRDTELNKFVVDATLGFAIARTDSGAIIREFGKDGLAKADYAVANARTELAVDIKLEDEPVEEVEDLEDES